MGAAKENRYTEKYSEEEAIELFEKAANYSYQDKDCLSVQAAIRHIDIPHSTFYDLIRQHKGLDNIKNEIVQNVLWRINDGGLKGKFNPTIVVWRSKQLGETDKQVIEQTVNDKVALLKELPPEERAKRIKELIKELKI